MKKKNRAELEAFLRKQPRITGREAVRRILEETTAAMAADGSPLQRSIFRGPDDTTGVRKPFGLAARTKAASPEEIRRLVGLRGITWRDGYEDRTVPYWASDERPDAHGDIVRQDWLFDLYEANSPLCDSHRWEDPPIGAGIQWEVRQRADSDYRGPALWILTLFADAATYDWADQLHRLVIAGFLKGVSVGFASDVVIRIDDPVERQAMGLGPYGLILEQNHLLELSPTTLGANPGALSVLMAAKRRGALQPTDVPVARELLRRDLRGDPDVWRRTDSELVACARSMFDGLELAPAADVDQPLAEHAKVARGLRGKDAEPPAEAETPAEDLEQGTDTNQPGQATTEAVLPDAETDAPADPATADEQRAEAAVDPALEESIGEILERQRDLEGAVEELAIGVARRLSELRDLIEDIGGGSMRGVGGELTAPAHTDRSGNQAAVDAERVTRVHAGLDSLRDLVRNALETDPCTSPPPRA